MFVFFLFFIYIFYIVVLFGELSAKFSSNED